MAETQAMWVGREQPSISHKDSGFETSVPLVGHSRAADTCEAGWEVWGFFLHSRGSGGVVWGRLMATSNLLTGLSPQLFTVQA